MATNPIEKILIAEGDPEISDLIARQALKPSGYQVSVAADGSNAIRLAVQFQPDVLITNLNLPGLSGKDLLVALSSQGISMPTIVMAEKGQENSIIQAFRLGANDYLMLPAREAEVIACVERAFKQVRETRAREILDAKIKQTNAELGRKIRDLSTIFAVGHAVMSITDQRVLLDKIVEAITTVTEADLGWMTLKEETARTFVLSAHRNLPDNLANRIGQTFDDGLSPLVAMSAETLSIHGQPLKKFYISNLGQSAMVVPIKIKNEAIGLLTVVRRADKPFGESEHHLAEGIADYASISLVNARLIRALAQNLEKAQLGEKQKNAVLERMRQVIHSNLTASLIPLDSVLTESMGTLIPLQKQALVSTRNSLTRLIMMVTQQDTQPKP